MTNYVNFLTDKIRPAIVQAYLDGPGTAEDFINSDSSTIDYTKFGYTASVLRNMFRNGSADEDVLAIVNTISSYENADGLPNYKQRSSSGYSIADMMIYDARSDLEFSIVEMATAMDEGFVDYFNDIVLVPSSSSVGSALHMMVEFKLGVALEELSSEAYQLSAEDEQNTSISPLFYALKRAADDNMSSERVAIYDIVKGKYDTEDYEGTMGVNTKSTTNSKIGSELSKFIMSTTHDTLKASIDSMLTLVSGDVTEATLLKSCVTKANGISKNNVTFDIGIYEGGINGEQNKGYSPLFYYVNRYKTSCDTEVLTKMCTKYSPFNISIANGETEGYTPMGMLAALVSITGGEWAQPELAAWIKAKLEELGAETEYEFFVSSGNVRDFTGGKSVNAYGVVTNIFRTINTHHKQLKNDYTGDDFDFDATTLITAIFPEVITSVLYEEWMLEFGQEV